MSLVGLLRRLGLELIEQGTQPGATPIPATKATAGVAISVSIRVGFVGVLSGISRLSFGQDLRRDLLGGAACVP